MQILNDFEQNYLNNFKEEVNRVFSGELNYSTIEAMQLNKLQKNLKYVYDHSPFYKRVLAPYTNIFNSITVHIQELPFTTKDDLRWTPSLGQDRGIIKVGFRYPQWIWY